MRRARVWILLCLFLWTLCASAQAAPDAGRKLIVVLDASRSLYGYTDKGTGQFVKGTDPDGFRFDAIEEFLSYLRRDAATGSHEQYEVGYVIFSNDIDASKEPGPLDGMDLSRAALETASARAKGQYTNIGAALWEAARLTGKGSPNAKTAILLVSDGLTDLGRDAAALQRSQTLKADALQFANEHGIPILTLCLNMNGDADTAEMKEIATDNALYRELNSNRYLSDELFALLTESVGTDTVYVPAPDDAPLTFREGALNIPFVIPGFGLDSVQIMLVGRTFAELDDVRLTGPDNFTLTREELLKDGDALLNAPVDRPGDWILHLEGRDGDAVRLRLLYNADLQVNVSVSDAAPFAIQAVLEADGVTANQAEQYDGFRAELLAVSDAAATTEPYREIMKLSPDGSGFAATFAPSEPGKYRFAVRVSAPGELSVAEDAQNVRSFPIEPCQFMSDWTERAFQEIDNPPRVLQDPVSVRIYLGDALSVDLRKYVEDESPDTLSFAALRVPDGVEASLSDGILSAQRFDLSEGDFVVSVTDAAGQSAELYLQVMARARPSPLIPIFIVLALILALCVWGAYTRTNAPYYGTIEIMTEINGVMSPRVYAQTPRKGVFPLSAFGIDNFQSAFGMSPGQCAFSPSGKTAVVLRFPKAVRSSLPPSAHANPRKVTVQSGQKVAVFMPDRPGNRLMIRYDGKAPVQAPRKPKAPKIPKPPKAPRAPKPPKR